MGTFLRRRRRLLCFDVNECDRLAPPSPTHVADARRRRTSPTHVATVVNHKNFFVPNVWQPGSHLNKIKYSYLHISRANKL